jgi:hypothetical protein
MELQVACSPRDTITLEFLGRQVERLLAEVAGLRDELRVQGAICTRLDPMMGQMLIIQTGMLEQMRTMVAQHQRFADRPQRLEEKTEQI